MSIPAIKEIKPKTLQFLADGEGHSQQEISLALAGPDYFNLAQEQLAEKRANGKPKFFGRCETASTCLKGEGLIEYPKKGSRKITADGLKALNPQQSLSLGKNPGARQNTGYPGGVVLAVKTAREKAVDPSTKQVYSVEMPAPEEVRKGILELEFPTKGIRVKDAAVILADRFQLSDEQRNAEDRHGLNVFRYATVAPAFRYLLQNGRLTQPRGPRKPYVLGPDSSLPIPEPDPPIPEPDPSVSFEETAREIQEELEANLLRKDGKLWVALPYHIEELEANLLRKVKGIHPTFFEKLVINLLEKMGYGAGEVLGGSRDDGIDGIITDDDRLELYRIYVQAKRWEENKVGKPDIQQFAGALIEQDATMGIFVTTSRFTSGAREFAENTVDPKIVLVEGKQLARLLLEYNVFPG